MLARVLRKEVCLIAIESRPSDRFAIARLKGLAACTFSIAPCEALQADAVNPRPIASSNPALQASYVGWAALISTLADTDLVAVN